MVKKLLALALLLPGVGGCIIEEGGHRGHHGSVIVAPIHAHCYNCRHEFRGGVWVRGR